MKVALKMEDRKSARLWREQMPILLSGDFVLQHFPRDSVWGRFCPGGLCPGFTVAGGGALPRFRPIKECGQNKVTIRPAFSRTVLYFWVLSWISRCPGFVLDLKSSE